MASARPPSADGYGPIPNGYASGGFSGRPPRSPSSLSNMSATSFTANAIDRLNDLNTCKHCKKMLTDARVLPCHHSFCSTCIKEMISLSTRNEFLCPIDRTIIVVPQLGIDAFPADPRSQALEDIKNDLEASLASEDPETADLDINLESLNKGVKDIEHSSAMAQHEVNTMFENIQKNLKKKQESFIAEIRRKSRRQINLMEFEKFRLIQTKKFQSDVFMSDSFHYVEDKMMVDPFKPFNELMSINTSTPPSPNSILSNQRHHSTSSDPRLTLLACHIGQQHIDFSPSDGALTRLKDNLDALGKVACDFDLKVKLDRNLLALDEYPFGMKIGGADNESLDWTPNQPKGLCKRSSNSLLFINSGHSELIEMDNSFNVIQKKSGRNFFSNNISGVTAFGGYIYVADAGACQVVMLNKDGSVVKRFGKQGAGAQEFQRPNGICVDSRGRVIVADSLNHRVKILSPDLKNVILTISNDRKKYREAGRFSYPYGVACDKEDNIYIVDTNNKRLVQLNKDGRFLKEIYPSDIADPRCVAVTSDNRILLTDRENGKLLIIDTMNNFTTRVSGIIDNHGREMAFKQPYGVVVDGTDKVFVSDIERNAIFVL